MERLFGIHSLIYHKTEGSVKRKHISTLRSLCIRLTIFFQLIILIKKESNSKSNENLEVFWNLISFFEPFTASLKNKVSKSFFVFILVIMSFQYFFMLLVGLLVYLKKNIPRSFLMITHLNYIALSELLMIPIFHLLFFPYISSGDRKSKLSYKLN